MTIRQLTPDDTQAAYDLRLRALQDTPEAYTTIYDELKAAGPERMAGYLRGDDPTNVTWGAFEGDTLVGMCAIVRERQAARQHKANLVAVFVAPEARGKGLGRALCEEAIRYTRTLDGIEELVLGVTVGNDRARGLYISLGFEPYCVEPRAVRIDGVYYDHEMMILRWGD